MQTLTENNSDTSLKNIEDREKQEEKEIEKVEKDETKIEQQLANVEHVLQQIQSHFGDTQQMHKNDTFKINKSNIDAIISDINLLCIKSNELSVGPINFQMILKLICGNINETWTYWQSNQKGIFVTLFFVF